jgi:hypothetical protein
MLFKLYDFIRTAITVIIVLMIVGAVIIAIPELGLAALGGIAAVLFGIFSLCGDFVLSYVVKVIVFFMGGPTKYNRWTANRIGDAIRFFPLAVVFFGVLFTLVGGFADMFINLGLSIITGTNGPHDPVTGQLIDEWHNYGKDSLFVFINNDNSFFWNALRYCLWVPNYFIVNIIRDLCIVVATWELASATKNGDNLTDWELFSKDGFDTDLRFENTGKGVEIDV